MHKSARLEAIGEQMNLVLRSPAKIRHWLLERALDNARLLASSASVHVHTVDGER